MRLEDAKTNLDISVEWVSPIQIAEDDVEAAGGDTGNASIWGPSVSTVINNVGKDDGIGFNTRVRHAKRGATTGGE